MHWWFWGQNKTGPTVHLLEQFLERINKVRKCSLNFWFIKGVALLRFNTAPLGAVGTGDLFPRIRKDFKDKSSIPQGLPCGGSLKMRICTSTWEQDNCTTNTSVWATNCRNIKIY